MAKEKILEWLDNKECLFLSLLFERFVMGKKPKICYFVEQYQLLSEEEKITVKPKLILTKSVYQYYKNLINYPNCYNGAEGGVVNSQSELNDLLTNVYKSNSIDIILK